MCIPCFNILAKIIPEKTLTQIFNVNMQIGKGRRMDKNRTFRGHDPECQSHDTITHSTYMYIPWLKTLACIVPEKLFCPFSHEVSWMRSGTLLGRFLRVFLPILALKRQKNGQIKERIR